MTKTSNHKLPPTTALNSVVLFGVDDQGKPKAAQFPDQTAAAATKAAGPLQLQVLAVTDPAIADLAKQLPIGQIHANGRGLVPYIRRDLYAKLIAAVGPAAQTGPVQPAVSAASTGKGSDGNGGTDHGRPHDWDEISKGHLVIAQESLEDGWYEAVVVERHGDMLALRWRDFPRDRGVTRHRLSVARLYPKDQAGSVAAASATAADLQPAKTPAAKRAITPATSNGDAGFPQIWDDIHVDHLVLAKQDGPWGTWFEAIPIEDHGDTLTLRWRDYPRIPPVVRPRLSLALLYPKP